MAEKIDMRSQIVEAMRTRVKHLYFVGIGGSGMNGIAQVMLNLGYQVSGSDLSENAAVMQLKAMGATVYIGHAASQIEGCDAIVVSSAIRDDNPVLYLENRVLYTRKEAVPKDDWLVPLGVAAVRREGTDITVVATGNAVHKALAAAEKLGSRIDAEVVDPRTLDPLDMETILESVEKTGALLVVQEGVPKAGFAAEVVRRVVEEGFDLLDYAPITLGAWDVPVPFSPVLEDSAIPQVEDIVHKIEGVLGT